MIFRRGLLNSSKGTCNGEDYDGCDIEIVGEHSERKEWCDDANVILRSSTPMGSHVYRFDVAINIRL